MFVRAASQHSLTFVPTGCRRTAAPILYSARGGTFPSTMMLLNTEWRLSSIFYSVNYGIATDVPPLIAFLRSGEQAGHVSTPVFDADYYCETHADVIASGVRPFSHFIRVGLYRDYALSRLFDNAWYRQRHSDVGGDVTPVEDFVLFGMFEGRDPGPLFWSTWYGERNRDRDRAPFLHYVENGHLAPNPLFDPSFVARQLLSRPEPRESRSSAITADGAGMSQGTISQATILFTSIARNYLPNATVLAGSVRRHDPAVRFVIVLCDELDETVELPPCVDEILPACALLGEDFAGWAFQHDLVELCTAAKGFALEHFFARPGCERVIYLDPDIYLTGDLLAVYAALDDNSIVVTPHLLSPEIDADAIEQNEFDALRHGAFNLGFLAVRNDEAGRRFAQWWSRRLRSYCVDRRSDGLFVDQKWMDLAPSFFPELGILRHPGHNVAPWNLSRRKVASCKRDSPIRSRPPRSQTTSIGIAEAAIGIRTSRTATWPRFGARARCSSAIS